MSNTALAVHALTHYSEKIIMAKYGHHKAVNYGPPNSWLTASSFSTSFAVRVVMCEKYSRECEIRARLLPETPSID